MKGMSGCRRLPSIQLLYFRFAESFQEVNLPDELKREVFEYFIETQIDGKKLRLKNLQAFIREFTNRIDEDAEEAMAQNGNDLRLMFRHVKRTDITIISGTVFQRDLSKDVEHRPLSRFSC